MKKLLAFLLSFVVGIINPSTNKTPIEVEDRYSQTDVIEEEIIEEKIMDPILEEKEEDSIRKVIISAIGDCTLGRDLTGSYTNSLPYYLEINQYDYSYFFRNVYDILSEDDLTIANLEGPLTNATVRADKTFAFKGDPSYTQILKSGSVEAVNLANNHSKDYLDTGYQDTIDALDTSNINYFGNGIYSIVDVDGIQIGLVGINGWNVSQAKKDIDQAKTYFEENHVSFIIYSFHWGIERDYKQNSIQEEIARYAIDFGGANLVLGHHPHVLQGIEKYNGVYIIYSLANFCFGGNKNPSDKYTMILQMTYTFENENIIDTEIKIIPTTISSTMAYNDYQPTVANEETSKLILKRILNSSINFTYEEKDN